MKSKIDELSRAIVLFLGFGSAPSPCKDQARIVQEFGSNRSAAILAEVIDILRETGAIPVDWSNHSLKSAGDMVRAEMHARYPGLSGEALQALAWKFPFDWR